MPAKRIYTKEMLADLGKMTDKDFGKKWGINRVVVIRNRNKMGIPSFLPKSNVKRKTIDGVEYKWCPRGGGHWEILSEFKPSPTRAGGYRGICYEHEKQDRIKDYHKNNRAEKARVWRKTENGKKSLRRTWRKQTALKNGALVKWSREDEERAYKVFGGRCGYCATPIPFLKIEFDHFIPVARGGKTEPKNMIPCCTECNHGTGGKFNRDAMEWLTVKFGEARAIWIYKDVKSHLKVITENLLGF